MATVLLLLCAAVLQVVPVMVWRARPFNGAVGPLVIRAVSGWFFGTIVFVALAVTSA